MSDNTKKIILTVSIVALIITVGITIYLIILKNKQTSSDTQPLDSWSSTQKNDLDTFLKDKVNNISIPPVGGMTGINIPLSLSQIQLDNISNNIIKNYKYDEYTIVKRPLFSLSQPVPNDNQIEFQIFLLNQLKDQSTSSNTTYSEYFDWNYISNNLLKGQITDDKDKCALDLVIKKYPNPLVAGYIVMIFSIYYMPNPLNNNTPLQVPLIGNIRDLVDLLSNIESTCAHNIQQMLFNLL